MATSPASRWSRRSRPEFDLDEAAPRLPWSDVWGILRGEEGFRQGDHVAIIGPTGGGKTHLALELAELRSYVMVLACKRVDPLIEETRSRGYYLVPGHKLEVPYADGVPVHKRVVYWPRLPIKKNEAAETYLARQKAHQKPRVGEAIGYVAMNGHWALVIDEGTWVCRDLGKQRDVDSALFQFRTLKASVIILGQRPSWMGQYVLSQPTHLFLFQTSHGDDLKSLGNVSGVNTHIVREAVATLDHNRHEVLYVNVRTRQMFRTVAPPR